MFGYVIPNQAALTPEAGTIPLGLLRALPPHRRATRHPGRLTLSYDLTFLDLLLCSLYEGESACATGCDHCPIHPIRKVEWRSSGPHRLLRGPERGFALLQRAGQVER